LDIRAHLFSLKIGDTTAVIGIDSVGDPQR
jgi:hypothetical protein